MDEVMLLAITIGDLEQVKRLAGHSVRANSRHRTALSVAVEEEQREIADFLICNGADVNFVDSSGEPPLISAVRSGNLEMIQLLIEAGADINGKVGLPKRTVFNTAHTTPLQVAAAIEDIDVLNTLLAANADVNMKNIKSETPLHLAAHSGQKLNISRLVACGALLDNLDRQGYTALHHAISEGHTDCVRELCKLGSSINYPTSSGHTPLMLATSRCHMEALKVILQFEPNLNRREGHLERTVLHSIIEMCQPRTTKQCTVSINCDLDMLDCVVQAGADVNVKDKNQETPLHLCVQKGCEALLDYLIRCKNINVSETNIFGCSPLMTACSTDGNQNIIELLIRYCPSLVKPPERHECCGLMLQLATVNNLPGMELLLEAGYRCQWNEAQKCQEIQRNDVKLVKFVHEQLLQPWPLLRLCRATIRNCLQTQLHSKIFQLPLPQKLRDQIVMENVAFSHGF